MAVRRVRQTAVAGYFYPREPEGLRDTLRRLTGAGALRVPAHGAIVPHAGYAYSGAIAGETFGRLMIPRRCVILGPNHTGGGARWSLMTDGAYQTPLGEVPIDGVFATSLLDVCPFVVADERAHRGEHAIEVLLPFLQWLGPEGLTIVPLVIGSHDTEEIERVACALAHVVDSSDEPVLLLASSDFTHHAPQEVAARQDAQAIEAIQTLDERQFLQRVQALKATMCGIGPVACVLGASKRLGATTAHLVRYATSAEAGGDPRSVVGYAGIMLN